MIDDISSYQLTHADLTRGKNAAGIGRLIPTFLSDLDAPEPVHPVVYSPWTDHDVVGDGDKRRIC